ncbi:hypothetical protein BDZ88DRAFT_399827 [Geranomyces variabilis]|nr:hypothetical protein BDZ88DRAFT_399827 [Geranomyces variabilis]
MEDFDLEWSYARIGFEDDVLPLECGCVQEPRTSVEVAVIRIANLIRNTPCWRTLLRDANAVAKWRYEAEQEAEALSDHQMKTTFSELFNYALEECMDDAQNAPTRFGTYGVHFEDGLIPSATESALKAHAAFLLDSKLSDQIYRLPREPYNDARDWLPQLEALVDLIHPSRYSLASHNVALPPALPTRTGWARRSCNFQWLPVEFHLETGADRACFSSYINNVNPIRHCEVYDAMATVLGQLVPLFEHVLTDLQRPRRLVIDWQCKDHYREPKDATDEVIENFRDLMAMTNVHWDYKPHPPPPAAWPRISLCGRQLQVIVKQTQVLLMPSKPHQPAGRWHVEGLEHERIVAIGIYCLDVKNVSTPSLGLRSATGNPPRYVGEEEAIMAAFGMVDEDRRNQYLGEINLVPGRCVAFPNVYQHKFSAISLLDRTRNGHSTLISFLLIDPSTRITSTLQVPPQQPDWTDLATSGVDDDALVEQQTEERLDLSRLWHAFDNFVKLDD